MKDSDRIQGFCEQPKSRPQHDLALVGKNFIHSLSICNEVQEMLARGIKSSEIREFILQKNEARGCTAGTIDKYLQVYKRFFITPMDYLRARNAHQAGATQPDQRTIVGRKISMLPGAIRQLEDMEQLGAVQKERLLSMYEREKDLGGRPFPDYHKELRAFTDLNNSILERKMDLGLVPRIPKRFKVIGDMNDRYPDIDSFTQEEREACLKIGAMAQEMFDMVRSQVRNETTGMGRSPTFWDDGSNPNGKKLQ